MIGCRWQNEVRPSGRINRWSRTAAAAALVALFAGCGHPVDQAMAGTTEADLVGSRWVAEDIGGQAVTDRVQSKLAFDAGGMVSGAGGCNRYFGPVTIRGEAISFGNLASTMMACPPAQMEQERRFFDALSATRSYRHADARLVFLGEDGRELIRFAPLTE
jgi:heat shock protein HslJ